jgi:single-stranded-DNA-specific exonuclease
LTQERSPAKIISWNEPVAVEIPAGFRDSIGGHPLLSEVLWRRGFQDPLAVEGWFHASSSNRSDAFDLPDLGKAVERLKSAIRTGERIGVWGDFDVDGQTATTLLVSGLRQLGAKVNYYIPVRARESHGVALPALDRFLNQGIQLLLTCDTGITAQDAVQKAASQGVDTIITDHHALPSELPGAFAVVNPQRLFPGHPLSTLCGVGCAFQVLSALTQGTNSTFDPESLLDLVALGTVADLAILTGDNRALVQKGIEVLRRADRPGLVALYEMAEMDPTYLGEEHISFSIAPRLNAVGRLSDSNPVVDFLTGKDVPAAQLFAAQIEGLNARRQMLSQEVFAAAQAQIRSNPGLLDEAALVLSHPTWPAGIVGIVASRLVEFYHKPVVLISSPPGELARGSARSIEGVNITAAISRVASSPSGLKIIHGFGGHPMAAGLSIDAGSIPEFRRALSREVAEFSTSRPSIEEIAIDAFVDLPQVDIALVESLEQMAPFGPGNPSVQLASRSLSMKSHSVIGKNGDHLRLVIEDSQGISVPVLWWQGAGFPLPEGRFDLAYRVRASNFRGKRDIQIEYVDARLIDEPAITISSGGSLEPIDMRLDLDPDTSLHAFLAENTVSWAEGEEADQHHGVHRNELAQADCLIIYTTPPGPVELKYAMACVKPQKVIFFAVEPAPVDLKGFLTHLGGMIKFILSSRDGRVMISDIAAAIGHRMTTVDRGIAWYAARGFISVIDRKEESLQLINLGKANPVDAANIERELTVLLKETAAYRDFYRNAPLEQLLR